MAISGNKIYSDEPGHRECYLQFNPLNSESEGEVVAKLILGTDCDQKNQDKPFGHSFKRDELIEVLKNIEW